MMNESALKMFDGFQVALMPTTHFWDKQRGGKFALNVVGKATILAQSLEVGKELEVAVSSNGKATAVILKISDKVAILKTGWPGTRKRK